MATTAWRSRAHPTFWCGNFILFSEVPSATTREQWEETFDHEFHSIEGLDRRVFAWDRTAGEVGDAAAFVAAGYTLEFSIFLGATSVERSPNHRPDVDVRTLQSDGDWEQALRIQHASIDPESDTPSFRTFQTEQMERCGAMTRSGFAECFGAFLGTELVAVMGLVVQAGRGRCQGVATDPAHRRARWRVGHCACGLSQDEPVPGAASKGCGARRAASWPCWTSAVSRRRRHGCYPASRCERWATPISRVRGPKLSMACSSCARCELSSLRAKRRALLFQPGSPAEGPRAG